MGIGQMLHNKSYISKILFISFFMCTTILYIITHIYTLYISDIDKLNILSISSILIKSVSVAFLFIIISNIFFVINNKYRLIGIVFFCIITTIYNFAILTQTISLLTTDGYIPDVAFDNMNNISIVWNYIYTLFIILYIFCLLPVCMYFYKYITMPITKITKRNSAIIVCVCICLLVIFNLNTINPDKIITPFEAFAEVAVHRYDHKKEMEKFMAFNSEYGFIKQETYSSNQVFNQTNEKPNIIILLPDGVPARLINGYIEIWAEKENVDKTTTFPNLTPNIDSFMNDENTLIVDNYFNHTAATYPGLFGTLTSLHPYERISPKYIRQIIDNETQRPNVSSLPGLLSYNGYKNFFIDANREEKLVTYMMNDIMKGFEYVYNNDNKKDILPYYQETDKKTSHFLEKDVFETIRILLEQDDGPKSIMAYFLGTHLNFNPKNRKDGVVYGDGSNVFFNALHDFDYHFGKFMEWFHNSKYKDNTIIVLTTDHTHFPDKEYINVISNNTGVVSKDFKPIFHDKICFLIYSKMIKLPKYIDANWTTSLDFTPTILHILGYKHYVNAFLGDSIFSERSTEEDISIFSGSYGTTKYYIKNKKLGVEKNPQTSIIKDEYNRIMLQEKLMYENKLFYDYK